MSTRRGFLASILAAGFAPAAIGSGVLMPVKKIASPIGSWADGEGGFTLVNPMTRQEMQHIINAHARAMMDAYPIGAGAVWKEYLWTADGAKIHFHTIKPNNLAQRHCN
jgi:hypothetical protein